MAAVLLIQQTVPLCSLWGDYVKTIVILIGICLLAVGALKFVGPRVRARSGSVSGGIRVLARQALEPRKTLYVVRAGHTTMLIATSGDSVHFMALLGQADFPEERISEAAMPGGQPSSGQSDTYKTLQVSEQV
jgi:flagellar biogenesis protein FliO